MAGKLKGQSGIKGFMLLHGEKIAISLVGLVALWLIYKTTSLPHLEDKYQATKLRDEINQTSSAVRDSQWPDPTSELAAEVRPAVPVNQKADAPVNPEAYKTVGTLDTPIVAATVLRPDPVLLNAVSVRANGGSGLFAFMDEAVRKQRELELAQEAAELAKKEADRQAKEQQANQAGEGAPGGRRNNRNPEGEMAAQPYDPAHPKRRPLEGMTVAPGVPRQGGERIERASWACVVAKVPIREQLKLFQDAFEKAKLGFDPARDFPQYKGYVVQRAEVLPGKDLDWKPVPVYAGERKFILSNQSISTGGVGQPVMEKIYQIATTTWAGMLPDVVDARFTDFILTFPLPPLVGRDWGAEATHPDIPLLANTPPLEQEELAQPVDPAQSDRSVDSPFGTSTNNQLGGPGGMPGGYPGMGMRMPGMGMEGGMGMRPGMGGPGMGMRMPGMGMEGGGARSMGAMPGAPGSRVSLPKGVDFLLLRFFDFTVEPGKKYRYRVSLVVADPNYSMPDNVLTAEAADRRRQETQLARTKNRPRPDYRRLEGWSDPSPTVGIPLAGSTRLVDVKMPAAERFNDEPTANLLVEGFDVDEKGNAIQAANKKEFRRGSVANMVEDAKYLGEGWIDTWEKFKFVTGMTLLDIQGGKKLAKDYTSPGRVLLMGPAGELYVRNEVDDKPAVEYHDFVYDPDDKRRNQDAYGPEGPGGFGRPRGGGRGPR